MENFNEMVERFKNELLIAARRNPEAFNSQVRTQNNAEARPQNNAEARPQNNIEKGQQNNIKTMPQSNNETEIMTEFEEPIVITKNVPREIKVHESYEEFMREHPKEGYFSAKVFVGNQALPLSGARVVISKKLKDYDEILFDGFTDKNGMIDSIILPASSRELLEEENKYKPCAMYRVTVTHPEHIKSVYDNISLFDSMRLLQGVNMIPIKEAGNGQYYFWFDKNTDDDCQ